MIGDFSSHERDNYNLWYCFQLEIKMGKSIFCFNGVEPCILQPFSKWEIQPGAWILLHIKILSQLQLHYLNDNKYNYILFFFYYMLFFQIIFSSIQWSVHVSLYMTFSHNESAWMSTSLHRGPVMWKGTQNMSTSCYSAGIDNLALIGLQSTNWY